MRRPRAGYWASSQAGQPGLTKPHATMLSAPMLPLLADCGQQRAPSIPDLIIAATAELAGLTMLHLDKDFGLIADITGQAIERLNTG
jgi:hypothetical protein